MEQRNYKLLMQITLKKHNDDIDELFISAVV
jgi:hypothetical protein